MPGTYDQRQETFTYPPANNCFRPMMLKNPSGEQRMVIRGTIPRGSSPSGFGRASFGVTRPGGVMMLWL